MRVNGGFSGGFLGRALRRITDIAESDERREAAALQSAGDAAGATDIVECTARERARVVGVVESVKVAPRAGAPNLEAELYDGTDVLRVVWLGRRRITGIAPGTTLAVTGMVADDDGRKTMYNPAYELFAA